MIIKRNIMIYDVEFLMIALDYVLDFMDLDSKFSRRSLEVSKLYVKT
jgi:hypothetical protein